MIVELVFGEECWAILITGVQSRFTCVCAEYRHVYPWVFSTVMCTCGCSVLSCLPMGVQCRHVYLWVFSTVMCTCGCSVPSCLPVGIQYRHVYLWVLCTVMFTCGCSVPSCLPVGAQYRHVYLWVLSTVMSTCGCAEPVAVPVVPDEEGGGLADRGLVPRGARPCLSRRQTAQEHSGRHAAPQAERPERRFHWQRPPGKVPFTMKKNVDIGDIFCLWK